MNIKKIFYVEYDENGNEIYKEQISDVTNGGIITIGYNLQFQKCGGRQDLLLDKHIRDKIPNEWWDVVDKFDLRLVGITRDDKIIVLKETVEFIEWYINLDEHIKQEINDRMEWEIPGGYIPGNIISLMNSTKYKPQWDYKSVNSTIDYIMNCDGEYYSIDDKGVKTWYYGFEKPTLKQIKYQRRNGKRVIKYIPKTGESILITESEYK